MDDSESREHNQDDADEQIVSMVDVLNDEQQLQDDANAVLGACDENVCTYSQGYLQRQALYACVTCSTDERDPAGVCLACSLTCHDGHQLTELYTKRNFRCDCGNSKFSGVMTCKLCPDKEPLNENGYNHNFRGLYCTCRKQYPDPDDSVDDVMLQCVICEDWFHGRHLGVEAIPGEEDFDEVVCEKCLERCHFIRRYVDHFAGMSVSAVTSDDTVDVVGTADVTPSASSASVDVKEDNDVADNEAAATPAVIVSANAKVDVVEPSKSSASVDVNVKEDTGTSENEAAVSAVVSSTSSDTSVNVDGSDAGSGCLLHLLSNGSQHDALPSSNNSGAVFLKSSWRQHLCRCSSCLALYERLNVTFLLNDSDTIVAYEEQGKQKTASAGSLYQRGMDAFTSLGRIQQIELLQGYSELEAELSSYLKKFAENGKVVREEDIAEFFDQLKARKRQKTSETAMQYYCK